MFWKSITPMPIKLPQVISRTTQSRLPSIRSRRGYTMAEIIIVIIVLGLLAAVAIPVYNNIRAAGVDNIKRKNADMLNQMAATLHNGGVQTNWADADAAFAALRAGINIQSGGTVMVLRLDKNLTSAAYNYVPGTAAAPAQFTAITGQANVDP